MDEETREVLQSMSKRHDEAWAKVDGKLDIHMESLTKHRIEIAEKMAVVGERANAARSRIDEHIIAHCNIKKESRSLLPTWVGVIIGVAGLGITVLSFALATYVAFHK